MGNTSQKYYSNSHRHIFRLLLRDQLGHMSNYYTTQLRSVVQALGRKRHATPTPPTTSEETISSAILPNRSALCRKSGRGARFSLGRALSHRPSGKVRRKRACGKSVHTRSASQYGRTDVSHSVQGQAPGWNLQTSDADHLLENREEFLRKTIVLLEYHAFPCTDKSFSQLKCATAVLDNGYSVSHSQVSIGGSIGIPPTLSHFFHACDTYVCCY